MNEFKPTHVLTWNDREIPVMVDPDRAGGITGPAYTQQEWDAGEMADWERNLVEACDDDEHVGTVIQFQFQGATPLGTFSYRTLSTVVSRHPTLTFRIFKGDQLIREERLGRRA